MKALLVLLLVAASIFAYVERQRIKVLEAELETTHQQLDEAQKQVATVKEQLAKTGRNFVSTPTPLSQTPSSSEAQPTAASSSEQKSGAWMWSTTKMDAASKPGKK